MINDLQIIHRFDPEASNAWDSYVRNHPQGTFFHLSGWAQVIKESFGHTPSYLLVKQNNTISGVLPLGNIKSRLFGNALISNPFCVYGGAIADSDDLKILLEEAAEAEAIRQGVDYLELRNTTPSKQNWPIKELYVTFRKEIDPDPDINMKAIPRKQRAMVRKGIKAGLKSIISDNVDIFYKIYSTSVRNHGTPVFSKNYFKILKTVFGSDCEIRLVRHGSEYISAVMNFYYKDEVLPYYGGGLPSARKYKAFDFMYWDVMQDACQKGIRIFDYGRSKIGTGSYSFKKNWGFEPVPLPYTYRLVNLQKMPEVNPLNPKYRLFIQAWQKLPLPLANTIGPLLARSLG